MEEDQVRYVTSMLLVVLMAVIGVGLWSVDLLTMQGVFGTLLSAELMAFAMLSYLYSKPSLHEVRTSWVVAGLASLVVFLIVGLTVSA